MTDENTQAVAEEGQDEAMPSPAPEGAQDEPDLSKLLTDFDRKTREARAKQQARVESKPPQKETVSTERLIAEIESLKKGRAEDRYKSDMGSLIKSLRGDFDANEVSDEFIEVWANTEGRKSPELRKLFREKDQHPAEYAEVVKALSDKFHKFVEKRGSQIDSDATQEREVVAAAVRGTSKRPPPSREPEYSGMSDAQFRASVRKKYGFDPI